MLLLLLMWIVVVAVSMITVLILLQLLILMLPFLSFFSNSILTKNLTLNYFIRVTSQHIEIGDFFHEIFFVPKRQFETFLHPWVNFINVLWAAITCTDPKSVKRQPSCQTLLRFWDLQVQKQLVERWWNWLLVVQNTLFCSTKLSWIFYILEIFC